MSFWSAAKDEWDYLLGDETKAIKALALIPLACIGCLLAMLLGTIVIGILEMLGVVHDPHEGMHCVLQQLEYHAKVGNEWTCIKWAK